MPAERGPQFLYPSMTASPETMADTGADTPDWDTHYGKAFRFAVTPEGAVEGGAKPGTVSLVTPHNKDAWTDWEPIPEKHAAKFKKNWNKMWRSTGGYKQRQVLSSMEK